MPFYDLSCKKCGETFNIKASIAQRENREILCPSCGCNDLEAVFKTVNYVVKSKGCEAVSCPQAHRCGAGCCH